MLVRYATLKAVVMDTAGLMASDPPTLPPTTSANLISVPASKRFDPLVVFLSGSYFSSASRQFAGTEIKFADVVGGRVGGSLAISPAVSITTAFNVAYLTNIHSQDLVVLNSVPNSDRLLSSVDVGFNTLLWNRTLLNLTAQFGITGHTPDFRLIAAIPVRF
jgi:hypothetical protein